MVLLDEMNHFGIKYRRLIYVYDMTTIRDDNQCRWKMVFY